MLLTYDLASNTLITSPGYNTPVTRLEAKRGDGEMVRLQFLINGQLAQAPALAEFKFCVKKRGDWATDAPVLALASAFVWAADVQAYEAACNYNTTALIDLMQANAEKPNDRIVDLMLEIAYRPTSAAAWQRSVNTPQLILHNNLIRGIETIPGGSTVNEILPANYLPRDRTIEYLPLVTGLTSGGPTNLDGLSTTARAVNELVCLVDATAGADIWRAYELVSSNVAESAPSVIRPDDYNNPLNPKVWRLRTSPSNVDAALLATKAESIEYLRGVTGLTGGGATKLDGLQTAGKRSAGHLVSLIDDASPAMLRVYELAAGTTAESSPTVIRPDDYNASTNAVVWLLRTSKTTFNPDDYLPKSNAMEFLSGVTGLTGGGASNLDGVTTAARSVGIVVGLVDDSASVPLMRHYELVAGTLAETAPSVIRPDDYNGSTNAKYWQLRLGATSLANVGSVTNTITHETGSSIAGYGTVGLPTGKVISQMSSVIVSAETEWLMSFYQLTADLNVASLSEGRTADVITPGDYNSSTNARKWVRIYPNGFGRFAKLGQTERAGVINYAASSSDLAAMPTAAHVAASQFPVAAICTNGTNPLSGGITSAGRDKIRFYRLRYELQIPSSLRSQCITPSDYHVTTNRVLWSEQLPVIPVSTDKVPVFLPDIETETGSDFTALSRVDTVARVLAGDMPLIFVRISGALRSYLLTFEADVPGGATTVTPYDYDETENAVLWVRQTLA